MNRRNYLKVLGASAAAFSLPASAAGMPIQLHLDLEVDPAKEKEMLTNYRTKFHPAITKQPGFVEVKLMKLRKEMAGKAPANCNYHLIISFQTEEQRVAWTKTDTHQKVWPTIEGTFKTKGYTAILYDQI